MVTCTVISGWNMWKRTVQLDVMQLEAHGAAKSGGGTQLVEDVITAVGRSDVDPATPEAQKVGKARMGPYGDSALLGSLKRPPHHGRIAGVKAAGDVRRGHGSQHRLVGAALPQPEALAHVGVDIDPCGHRPLTLSRARRT